MTTEHDSTLTVGRLVDQFLSAIKPNSAPATHEWYAKFLRTFVKFVGNKQVNDLTAGIVHEWMNKRYGHSLPGTRHSAARTVARLINWAMDERIIRENPIRGLRKPSPSRRETFVSPAQYAACVKVLNERLRTSAGTTQNERIRTRAAKTHKDIIRFLWHTGCRPQELRTIEARWIDGPKIVFPKEMSKGKRKRRVIYLDGIAKAIVTRLSKQHPEGPIFRNCHGTPWKKEAIVVVFFYLRKDTGIEGLCAYGFRHGFITRMLEQGTDVATVAALAGNSPRMVLDVYQHVAANESRLLAQLDG